MRYEVTATDLQNIRLNERETVHSVLQNIALILATPKGSVPFYRDFGLSQEFVDKPTPVAKAMLVAELQEAIDQWEPRARMVSVRFDENALEPGKLVPTVEVEISLADS